MPDETRHRVFVAGASGVVGRRFCPVLVDDGWQVVGTTRSPEKAAALRAIGVEPVIVNVFDAELLRDVARNARIREIDTRNLIAAAVAAGTRRMVAQSIAFAYAPGTLPCREDAPLNLDVPAFGLTARAVASLEAQVLGAPLEGIVLRYGRL